ncbi:unnamed protein product [Hydatigera taeniaeformis]|uniref:Secreted protein n=1 Tax=Hydatigena taeniaeformis TaxID=6205 RepID=A0A0R3XD94_HYDTA|nr:unnamed protein product [Hydatigera taeniaeformis]
MQLASVWLPLSLLFLHHTWGKVDDHQTTVYHPGTLTKVTIETIPQSKVFKNGERCECKSRRMKRFSDHYVGDECGCDTTPKRRVYTRAEELEDEIARREDEEEIEHLEAEIEARERREDKKAKRMRNINRIQIQLK